MMHFQCLTADSRTLIGIAVSLPCSLRQFSTVLSVSRLSDGRCVVRLDALAAGSPASSLRLTAELKSSRDMTSMSVALSTSLFGDADRNARQLG